MKKKDDPSSEAGSGFYYRVEARQALEGVPPKVIDQGFVLDREWRTVPTHSAPVGVPNLVWNPLAERAGLMTYEAAMAVAWSLHAGVYSVETRLVQFKHEYSATTTELGVLQPFAAPFGRVQSEPRSAADNGPDGDLGTDTLRNGSDGIVRGPHHP